MFGWCSDPRSVDRRATSAASEAPATEAPASEARPPRPRPALNTDYTACVAFDTGGLGDKGFNDLAQKGLDDAKALGYKTFFSEATGRHGLRGEHPAAHRPGLPDDRHGRLPPGPATIDATLANPDVSFAQVDAVWDETANGATPANFTGLDFQIDEAAMLAGYLAASFSQSKVTAPTAACSSRASPGSWTAGSRRRIYNQKKGDNVEVLGWDAAAQTGTFVGGDNPWNDPAKGEQLATTFLDQGVDIVHPVAGETGNGTIKAMLAAGKWAVGVDNDQAITLPEYSKAILTSAQKAIDVSVVETIKKNSAGDTGGENFVGHAGQRRSPLAPFHDLDAQVSAELKAEVEQLSADIAAGTVKVADYLK